jgi:chemotaxis methyl-accepting protein methylase
MNNNINHIVSYLNNERNFDISCYNMDFLERCLKERLSETGNNDYPSYLNFLQTHTEEITSLFQSLSINVSSFFRDTMSFDIISEMILPSLVMKKIKSSDRSLRIWSAGCASGEEPYSIAIIIKELIEKYNLSVNISIFGTDIDITALEKAGKGVYLSDFLQNIKYGLLKKYFTEEQGLYKIKDEIKEIVTFSIYDIMDKNSYAPPEAVFGSFDLVLCRNLLIYFTGEYQEIILKKLYLSLVKDGILVLGEFENLPATCYGYFKKYYDFCQIYQKQLVK